MDWGGAMRWAGGDPALPTSDPRVVDMSGTPGDFAVASYVRVIRCKLAVAASELLITHPSVTTATVMTSNQEGNATVTPEATRRWNVRPIAGGIVAGLSGGAIADDGPIDIRIEAI